jgi:hypothetical protein
VKIMFDELSVGSGVGVYGIDDDINCFAAELIIAEGQASTEPVPQ